MELGMVVGMIGEWLIEEPDEYDVVRLRRLLP